jgi:hypothetical protein
VLGKGRLASSTVRPVIMPVLEDVTMSMYFFQIYVPLLT